MCDLSSFDNLLTSFFLLHAGGKKIEIATPTIFGGIALTEVEWSQIERPTYYHPFR